MSAARRADQALVERGIFDSRARAQSAIKAGLVRLNGVTLTKAAVLVPQGAALEATPEHPFVSRGALKLVAALDHFKLDPKSLMCLDIGASTGGFSEVLLARGAVHVVAVDVGHGQLHPSLQSHPRLTLLEGRDARSLTPDELHFAPKLITMDVSFISATKILDAVLKLAAPGASLIVLVKPQFEVGRAFVGKGVVRDAGARQRACDDVASFVTGLGWRVAGLIPSPLFGGTGNAEYLLAAMGP